MHETSGSSRRDVSSATLCGAGDERPSSSIVVYTLGVSTTPYPLAASLALALEKRAEDFFLPSPTGSGVPLTPEELTERLDRLRPSVFFSNELCARYFTYMSRESGAHFVLFDDGDTLRRKIEVARRAGIHTFLAPWPQVREDAARLGLGRASVPVQNGR